MRKRRRNTNPDLWRAAGEMPRRLMRLEDRIVLDAAVADTGPDPHVDVASAFLKMATGGHPVPPGAMAMDFAHGDASPNHGSQASGGSESDRPDSPGSGHDPVRLLAISSHLNQADVLASAAADGVTTVVFDPDSVSLEALLAQIRVALHGRPADEISLATHGIAGQVELAGGKMTSVDTLHDPALHDFWVGLGGLLTPDGRIDLLGCDVAQSTAGHALLNALEAVTGANVAASTDATGNAHAGGDWILESGNVDASTLFNPVRLGSFTSLLVDTPPTITDSHVDGHAMGGGDAVLVDPGITVTDADPVDQLTGATVHIRDGFHADQDHLWYDDSPGGPAAAAGITGSYDASTGTLALSGFATAAQYQAVLRSVTYHNDDITPDTTPREILFTIGDNFGGHAFRPETGHYYLVSGAAANWAGAVAGAEAATLGSMHGYLATITSVQENVLASGLVPAFPPFPPPRLWLGGTDQVTEGAWLWLGGPEAGQQFWSGGAGGSTVNGMYAAWGAGQPLADDHLTILGTGDWEAVAPGGSYKYLIEFGGTPDQAEDGLNAIVTMHVADRNDAPVLDNTGPMTLDAMHEDDLGSAGTRIADLVASAGGDRITDPDPGAAEGIALIGLDTAHGTWQFSTDSGLTWQDVGNVSESHALLLRAADFIRFQPVADFAGTLDSAIAFRAWDQTAGTAGGFADTSTHGGESAFSNATGAASLSVQNVPDAPHVDAGLADQSATEDVPFSHAFAANAFADPDPGDALVYHATLADGSPLPAWLHFDPATRTFSGTPGDDGVGVWDVRVTATDGDGASASDVFALHVANVNDAPHAPQPLDHVTTAEDAPFTHTLPAGAFADPDPHDALTFSATLEDGSPLPHWLAFDPATHTFSGTPHNEDVGTLAIRVTATDSHGASAAEVFALTVENVNDAPVVVRPLADQSVAEGSSLHYHLPAESFRDPDVGDGLTYSAALAEGGSLPGWLHFDPTTGTFSGTPALGAAGMFRIRVTARDGDGATASDVFTIEVLAAPDHHEPSRSGGSSGAADGSSDGGDHSLPGGTGLPASDAVDSGGGEAVNDFTDGGHEGPSSDAGDSVHDAGAAGQAPAGADGAAGGGGPAPGDGHGATAGGGAVAAAGGAGTPVAAEGGGTATHHRDREEEPLPTSEMLMADFDDTLLHGDLLGDTTQPAEFRDAWHSILSAYTDSGDEVVAYLESAFRTVSESAYINQAAETVVARLEEELALAADAGLVVHADGLAADVHAAAADVKLASRELEAAILAAAAAGREDRFDQVLEDVIHASLDRLMLANEHLFVASQALAAATGVVHEARLEAAASHDGRPAAAGGEPGSPEAGQVAAHGVDGLRGSADGAGEGSHDVDAAALAEAAAQAREDAYAQITEMRASWDRVAQDVFRAFVSRLVEQQAEDGGLRPPMPPGAE